jgi:DNA-binding CsgD family transcriptional regulator
MPDLAEHPKHENDLFPDWMSARKITARTGIVQISLRATLDRADLGKGYAPPRVDPRLNVMHCDDYAAWRKAVAKTPTADRPNYPVRENPFAGYLTSDEVAAIHDTTAKAIGDALDRYFKAKGHHVPGTTSFGGRRLLRKGAWEAFIASKAVTIAPGSKSQTLATIAAAHTIDGVLDIPAAVADRRSMDFTAQELADAFGRTRQAIHNVRTKYDLNRRKARLAGLDETNRLTAAHEAAQTAIKDLVSPREARARQRAAQQAARKEAKDREDSERLAAKAAQAAEHADLKASLDAAKKAAQAARCSAVAEMTTRGFSAAQISEHLGVSLSTVTKDRRTMRLAARARTLADA